MSTPFNINAVQEKVMSRLAGRAGADGLAVFVRPDGDTRITIVGTSLYRDTMRLHPERLVAVYDEDADDCWVKADLQWAAANMVVPS